MSQSRPDPVSPDDSTRNLVGDWNLGTDTDRLGHGDPDESLLASPPSGLVAPHAALEPWHRVPHVPTTSSPPAPGTPVSPLAMPFEPSRVRDQPIFEGFRLDPDDDAYGDEDRSLFPPGASRLVRSDGVPGLPSALPNRLPDGSGGGAATGPNPNACASASLHGSDWPRLPRAGERVPGFLLVSELGRGAFARVFLAEQESLGGRLVALKVTRVEGDEPRMLAKLQHAHIVPIHSVFDDPDSGLRLLCMPYLGGANLAQVLEALGDHARTAEGRWSLVDALDQVGQRYATAPGVCSENPAVSQASKPYSLPRASQAGEPPLPRSITWHPDASQRRGSLSKLHALWDRVARKRRRREGEVALDDRDFDQPARQSLRTANITQAAVWIVARLADGLEHAHSRGLLHRDIKPSNILIAGDGTPMLLDFNLSTAAGPGDPAEGEKEMLGGTLPYMAPEHLEAFHPEGVRNEDAVDERSDLYSLGLILFEIIAGEHPFPEPPAGMPLLEVIHCLADQRKTAPSLRRSVAGVPWSLDSIVRKVLDPVPARRYARARDFAEDLNRFLADRPLKFAREPSPRERLAKWARRNPRLCGATSVAMLASVLVLTLAALIGLLTNHMQTIHAQVKLQAFRDDLAQCRFLLNLAGGPAEHLTRGTALAQRVLGGQAVRRDGRLRDDSWVNRLDPPTRLEVLQETAELLLIDARARVDLSGRGGTEGDRRRALEAAVAELDRAERLDPSPPSALHADRARYLSALGLADLAARDRRDEALQVPVTARDHSLLGTARLARGDLAGAEASLSSAVDLDPKGFWAWFALGHCHLEQGRPLDAAGDFAACVAIEPRFAWPHMNRGLALARAGRLGPAKAALEHAVRANPRFAEAWLNLALTDLELNELAGAEQALGRALALGLDGVGVRVAWAEVKARRGKRPEAEVLFANLLKTSPDDPVLLAARGIFRTGDDPERAAADLRRALELDPRLARAHFGLALLLRKSSPREALGHAEAALAADPNLLDALQLRALLRARLGDLAAVDDAGRLTSVPTPHRLYNAACALSLLVETAGETRLAGRAIEQLDRALDAGFPAAVAAADPDLNALHPLPAYATIFARSRR